MVDVTITNPPQDTNNYSWCGVCEKCQTPEEKNRLGSGLSHILG